MTKITFIIKMMSRGFSLEEARIASMFNICCNDYAWLSRRSQKRLTFLIRRAKKRYGSLAYKLSPQLPDVRAFIIQTWTDCGYVFTDLSSRPKAEGDKKLVYAGSGSGKSRYVVRPKKPLGLKKNT